MWVECRGMPVEVILIVLVLLGLRRMIPYENLSGNWSLGWRHLFLIFFFHPNNRQLRDGVLFMSSLEQLHSVFNFQAQEPVFCDPMALCFWSEISRKETSCTALFRMDESHTALYCAF